MYRDLQLFCKLYFDLQGISQNRSLSKWFQYHRSLSIWFVLNLLKWLDQSFTDLRLWSIHKPQWRCREMWIDQSITDDWLWSTLMFNFDLHRCLTLIYTNVWLWSTHNWGMTLQLRLIHKPKVGFTDNDTHSNMTKRKRSFCLFGRPHPLKRMWWKNTPFTHWAFLYKAAQFAYITVCDAK